MHVWGRHSYSSRKEGHKKEVGGMGRAVKLETRRLPSYTLKMTRVKTKAESPKKGFMSSSETILGFMFIYNFIMY